MSAQELARGGDGRDPCRLGDRRSDSAEKPTTENRFRSSTTPIPWEWSERSVIWQASAGRHTNWSRGTSSLVEPDGSFHS